MNSGAPVKVMHIVARMNVGGPAILVADLMRNLDPSKFETKLVTGYCDDTESDYLDEVATDIRSTRIPGFGRSLSVYKDLKAFFLLILEIRRFRPDVIHTHTAKAGVLGRLACLFARPKAKRIHTFHGHLLRGYFGRRKVRLIVLLEKLLGLITHKYVAIGTHVRNDLVNAGVGDGEKYEVIFPGLQDLDLHSPVEARNILGLDAEKSYVVFIGRLTQIKRPDRLMDLARSLKVENPSAHLLIAGAGELLDDLKEISEKESLPVTFLGWRNDIGMILSASNIAVLCSDNEGIPLTLIQASQAGLPIVSTNVGSVSDVVIDGVSGLLTEVTSEALITGVSSLLQDHALGEWLGKSGQNRARRLFSSDAMIKHHEDMYSQLL
jgi:glycosyltransferase involved in cell wall biosynthesis